MPTTPLACRSSPDHPPEGAFEAVTEPSGQGRFWFVCPGCKWIAAIALRPVVDGSPQSWEFDGNREAPTLRPSINHVGCWHGVSDRRPVHRLAGALSACAAPAADGLRAGDALATQVTGLRAVAQTSESTP